MTSIILPTAGPIFAHDAPADYAGVTWPKVGMPKVDGVYGRNNAGRFLGRSGKQLKNRSVTSRFSGTAFDGMHGELTLGNNPTLSTLCIDTSAAVRRILGEPDMHWWIWDYAPPSLESKGFAHRLEALVTRVITLDIPAILDMPFRLLRNAEEAEAYYRGLRGHGYEGMVLRGVDDKFQGDKRASMANQFFLRRKPWLEEDGIVVGLLEGSSNTNEQETNERGLSFRRTHAAGLVPSGMVGTIIVRRPNGALANISPGRMTKDECRRQLQTLELIGQYITYRHMGTGALNTLRQATYQRTRMSEDMPGDGNG